MKTPSTFFVAAFITLSGAGVNAQMNAQVIAQASTQPATTSSAEVTKIDKSAGRITLKHGEIKNLDMPPMTMVFRVVEPKLLDNVAVGDRVKFAAQRIDGNFTVVTISKAP